MDFCFLKLNQFLSQKCAENGSVFWIPIRIFKTFFFVFLVFLFVSVLFVPWGLAAGLTSPLI